MKRARLIEMWHAGVVLKQIADDLQCSVSRVSQIARELGLPPRQRGGDRRRRDYTAMHAEIRARHARHEGLREIAAALHISLRMVRMLEQQLGLTRPPAGRRSRAPWPVPIW